MDSIFVTKEVAQILRLSESKIRSLAKSGEIVAHKMGRKGGFRFTEKALDDYIEKAEGKLYPSKKEEG